MKRFIKILSIASCLLPLSGVAQSKLITQVIVHQGNGNVLTNAAVGIDANGKIDFVGKETAVNRQNYKEIINGENNHLYPGFIAPNATIGLQEIGAVRSTRDEREIGVFTPHVRSLVAYNTDSDILPTATANGVLTAQVTPRGGYVSGSSSVVSMDERNWEEAAIKVDDALHLYWPTRYRKSGWWANPGSWKMNDKYAEQLATIQAYFKKAKAYSQKPNGNDLQLEAMSRLLNNKAQLFVHVNDPFSILEAIQLKKEMGIERMVVVGGYFADQVAEELVKNQIPVLIRRVHDLPFTDDEPIDQPYKLAAKLKEQGVLVGLQNAGDMEQMNTRNMAFYAGTLTGYGYSMEDALMTVTSNNAKILGVDEVLGTIEEGKYATLFLSKGNALEMSEQIVNLAMIKGRIINPYKNKQLRLYEEYNEFYEEE